MPTYDEHNKIVNVNVQKRFSQRGVRGIFIGFDDYTPGYLIFIPSTRQIVTSIDVIFDEYFLSALVHKTRAYREALLTRPVNDTLPDPQNVTDHTGDISSSSFLPRVTTGQIEEEITIKNAISPEHTTNKINKNMINDTDKESKKETKSTKIKNKEILTTSLPLRKSTRIKNQNKNMIHMNV